VTISILKLSFKINQNLKASRHVYKSFCGKAYDKEYIETLNEIHLFLKSKARVLI
jgi:hypothetical protein